MGFEFFAKKFTESDLSQAEKEYAELVLSSKSITNEDEKIALMKKIDQAVKNYNKINKSVHKEMYVGREDAIIKPSVMVETGQNTSPNTAQPDSNFFHGDIGIGH